MLIAALYALSALLALLPNWLSCALVPTVMVGQQLLLEEEQIFKVGPARVYPVDVLMSLVIVKWLLTVGGGTRTSADRRLTACVGIWAMVNLLASLLAGVRYGEAHAMACLMPWMRSLRDSVLVFVLADAITSMRQARRAVSVLIAFLIGIVAIQFLNYLGLRLGFAIGEVQGIEREQVRIFGPVGDSVGFVLLLGYLYGLCRANLLVTAAFAGGILLTAGLGAILGMASATILFVLARPHIEMPRPKGQHGGRWIVSLVILAVGGIVLVGPLTTTLRDRLDDNYGESGEQRLLTARLAWVMVEDNLLTGVGYMGFRQTVHRYGGADVFDLDKQDGATANANNQFLQTLTDAGLVGLLSLAAVVVASALALRRAAVSVEDPMLRAFLWSAFLWLLAQLAGNLAATWLTPSSFVAVMLWLSVGVGLAVIRLASLAVEAECSSLERLPCLGVGSH